MNPECKEGECGPWSAPMISNPAFKGPWSAPLINNPEYQGVWRQKMIPNPDYTQDNEPTTQWEVTAVAFELWTMYLKFASTVSASNGVPCSTSSWSVLQSILLTVSLCFRDGGLTFDNIYVGNSVREARELSKETFAPKQVYQMANRTEEVKLDGQMPRWHAVVPIANLTNNAIAQSLLPEEEDDQEEQQYSILGFKFGIQSTKAAVVKFVARFRTAPMQSVLEEPNMAGMLVAGICIVFGLLSMMLGSSSNEKETSKAAAKKIDMSLDNDSEEDGKEISSGSGIQKDNKPKKLRSHDTKSDQ